MDMWAVGLAALAVVLLVVVIRQAGRIRALEDSIPDLQDEAIKEFKKASGRTRVGNAVQHLVPFMHEFPYDPSDARFIGGGPIDLIVFDGLGEGEIRDLVFVEVKTGKAKTNAVQKLVENCCAEGKVHFGVFKVGPDGDATFSLSGDPVEVWSR
jgi:predicted Holliday junction resolvase-like endonuclease